MSDSTVRPALRADLERSLASSRWNADAADGLALLDLMDHRTAEARVMLERARRVNPGLYRLHEQLGTSWLMENRPREALAEFQADARAPKPAQVIDLRLGQAFQALGRLDEARAAYRRALTVEMCAPAARESLKVLDRH